MRRLIDLLRTRPHADALEMAVATRAFLDELEALDWFHRVLQPFEARPGIERIDSWERALRICGSERSDAASLEAQNELTVQLSLHHRERYGSWNRRVDLLKPHVERLVDRKLALPAVADRLPTMAGDEVVDSLRYELLGACMHREFCDLVPFSAYRRHHDHWLLAGHFPCGWLGRVPSDMRNAFAVGRLAVL